MAEEKKNITEIREGENNVNAEGLLLEKKIHEGTTATGQEYLSVDLTIATSEDKTSQVDVSFFSTKTKKDGSENGLYKGLRTVADDFLTVADNGDDADFVRVNNARLGLNDYVGQDGQLRSFPQISGVFANRIDAGQDVNYGADFEVEIVVNSVVPEIDKETEEETGRVKLKAYIPLYGGKVIPFEFVVTEDGSGYVEDNYSVGDTTLVYGDIINIKEKTVTKIEAAFGEDKEKVVYNTLRENLVTGGQEPYEEDDIKHISIEAIKQGMAQREVYLEGLKDKAKNKNKGGKGKKKSGFDTKSPKTKKAIKDDDLPF